MISEQETLCNNNQELLQVPITHNNDNIEKDMNMAEIENENMPLNLPFDVSNDLKMFSKVFIVKIKDPFRAHHNCEPKKNEYSVFGELPDGDKKILFTVREHFECYNCCSDCILTCCLCDIVCCDKIVFQLDYRRNNKNFYTQGINLHKGCYCCKCLCCSCCSCCSCCDCCGCCNQFDVLHLRENLEPNNPDLNIGVKRGSTLNNIRCNCCQDKVVKYISQEGIEGHTLRLSSCEICVRSNSSIYNTFFDLEIIIENTNKEKIGSIIVPRKKIEKCCYSPEVYFEIDLPKSATSIEKFQIIAEAIHFNLTENII